jgi:hypothetical protein
MRAVVAHEFDVVVFRDVDRIARGPDLPVICREVEFAQVLLLGMDKTDARDASFRMRVGLSAIMSSEMIEKVRVLTRLALRARAKDGHHTGGRTFGYRSVAVDPTKPDERKRLVIDEVSAALVREIFARYAQGETMKAIVQDLNARKVPSAGAAWKRETRRKDGCWLVSALHAILHNEIYMGRMVYGRRQFVKNPTTGKARSPRRAPVRMDRQRYARTGDRRARAMGQDSSAPRGEHRGGAESGKADVRAERAADLRGVRRKDDGDRDQRQRRQGG